MRRISKLITLLLMIAVVCSMPLNAYASSTSTSIFTTSTYTHQTKFDGLPITEGIDVSYHNGEIDFQKVKNAGVKFVIMRVGFRGYSQAGNIKGDTKFEAYIKDAHAAGLDIGAYFYSQAVTEEEARKEAEFVIDRLKPYKSYITMPVAFDYEFAEVSSGRLDAAWNNGTLNKTKMTNNTIAFCEKIKSAGYVPMVYANKSFLSEQLDHTKLEKSYDIWMANYTTKTTYAGDYLIWQFSSKGKINGISGYVDANFMYSRGFEIGTVYDYVYTGKEIKPVPSVSFNGKTLKRNTDYTLSYQNNKAIGVATVTVTGMGDYAKYPKVSKTFEIIPDVVTGLQATTVKSDEITVTWDKQSGATGYQVWIKARSGWKNCGLTAKTEFTFNGLEAAYEHEISVRSYKTVNSYDVYGKYGDYLHVATKDYYPSVSEHFTGWRYDAGDWYYFIDGQPQKACWQKIQNKKGEEYWYYFDANYRMHVGWLALDGAYYYLTDSGEMAQYFTKIGKDWYYFTGNGNMRTGWLDARNKRYYFNEDGKMQTGFRDIESKRYYFDNSGALQTGWITADGKRYYAMTDGSLVRYSQMIKGEHYYFNSQYVMKTDWLKLGGSWYYFNDKGVRQTGWIEVKGVHYFLNVDGKMQTGWLREGETDRYLKDSGAMAVGWCQIENQWYYFNTSGVKATGWRYVNKKWYYMNDKGVMVRYRQTIDGKHYYFTGNGDMKYGWLKIGGSWYYYGTGGAMVTGTQTIGGKTYAFDNNGVWQG